MNLNFGKKRRLKKYSCTETLGSSEDPNLSGQSDKRVRVESECDDVMEDLSGTAMEEK